MPNNMSRLIADRRIGRFSIPDIGVDCIAVPALRALARKAILGHIRLYEENNQTYKRIIHGGFDKKFILARLRS